MSLRRAILDALEDAPGGLCDACLLAKTDAAYHQHVNAACRLLEREGRLVHKKERYKECDGCGNVRVINRLTPSGSLTVEPTTAVMPSSTFGINDLDDLRRQIIQLLNTLDPGSSREGFSKRVALLRNNQVLPTTIASLMLTHAAYRNELYYTPRSLSDIERRILEEMDKHLRLYLANNNLQRP